jgi:deazaflavin-dependent oxidoreductase (nitroreductase family)
LGFWSVREFGAASLQLVQDGSDEGGAMPLPRKVAELNKVGLNRVTRPLAGQLPGFGLVTHRGRRSGKEYRTPVNVFRVEGGFTIALTYGTDSDWVKNVLAAGECRIHTRGRTHHCTAPRLFHDESRTGMPSVVRQILALTDVSDFMSLTTVGEDD